jgi:tetratricopeptide (TPR) repeat protein
MRLSGKTYWSVICVFSLLFIFSCTTTAPKTQQEPTTGQIPAATTQNIPKQQEPAYSRVAFGEKLKNLLDDGKYDEAIALFDTVPEPDASSLSIRMLKLSILISAGKKAESIALANELEAAYPDNVEILYTQVILAESRDDLTGRTKYLNKILKLQPDNSQALTALGTDYLAQKNYPQAKTTLIRAISANPENIDALLGLARVYYMQADLDKAGSTLNLAIAKDPGYSVLWAERARVKSETNDLGGAIEDIKQAVTLDPGIYGQWVDYGNYLISSAKKAEAREAFTKAIELEPKSYLAYIYRAGLNDDLGNTDEAISDYTQICALYPPYYFAAESLGILLWGKGDYERSRQAFVQALSQNPKNTSYALMVTLCYYRSGKPDEAKKFMGKYIVTLDRAKTEYYLCRLFVDKSGDADVLNRIEKETDVTNRNRMLFYSAMYYDLFQSKATAQKFYIDITSMKAPTFFEYRLCQWALRDLENAANTTTASESKG